MRDDERNKTNYPMGHVDLQIGKPGPQSLIQPLSMLKAMDLWRHLTKAQKEIVFDHLKSLRDSSPEAQKAAFEAAVKLLEACS